MFPPQDEANYEVLNNNCRGNDAMAQETGSPVVQLAVTSLPNPRDLDPEFNYF